MHAKGKSLFLKKLASGPGGGQNPAVSNLLQEPAWRPEDLGRPLPESLHACSVCLPTWASVVGYEEGDPEVVGELKAGYPRFLLNREVAKLFEIAREQLCSEGEIALVFASEESARRAEKYLLAHNAGEVKVEKILGLFAVLCDEKHNVTARDYWKHTGEIVSSRMAQDALQGNLLEGNPEQALAKLSQMMGSSREDFFLYESGMAAIFAAHQAIIARDPSRKTLQVDFPYVDALKIQEKFGAGSEFLANAHGNEFLRCLERVRGKEFSAVFCEVPSNPLLRTVNLEKLSAACRESSTPLLVDDTISSHHNIDVLPFADIVTTSLTKWVSGAGDVMAGGLKLNPSSPLREEFRKTLLQHNPTQSRLYQADAEVLCKNSVGFAKRVEKASRSAEAIAEFLQGHEAVKEVWYPKFSDRANYEALRREGRGFGGLISFALKKSEQAPAVYNALKWSKGPSLGTEFSLACPYTLLAHYTELEWAAECGVPEDLIRLSVGIEEVEVLLKSLQEALEQA